MTTDPRRRRAAPLGETGDSAPPLSHRLALIAATVIAMLASARALQRSAESPPDAADAVVIAASPVIAAEAGVFRTRVLSVGAEDRRRPDAHPRTLATYHLLRSYPGAPPRVPHGLTATEFRTNRCNTCHERGGYSQRFGAYAPINPHPEWTSCLQCHATNALLVGVPFPQASSDDACRQCHSGTPSRFEETGLAWRSTEFPAVTRGRSGTVPPIPHDLTLRGNCLTCHVGPGAVAEIRVSHPERTSCRQCHVVLEHESEFVRSVTTAGPPAGVQR
jgi:cytochrome c-type protein NapB